MPLPTRITETLDSWADTAPAPARQEALAPLAAWLRANPGGQVLFVCTHNSRRSHIAQLWAQAAALHHGHSGIRTHSAGTEATAFNPRAVRAMRAEGFALSDTGERVSGDNVNVVYAADFGAALPAQRLWSKALSETGLKDGFAAVMVCDSADAACPVVFGAALRVSLPFVDPKRSDGQADEAAVYTASAREIGAEMAWLMRHR